MPHAQMPWMRNGHLVTPNGDRIVIDSRAWFRWLEQTVSFCYSSRLTWVRLTVRCEQRRHQSYWYGYSKIDGKLHNIYLGKRQQLTQVRLEQACQTLYQRASEKEETSNNSTQGAD